MQNWEEVQLAVAALRQRLGAALPSRPDAAIILGTGLSGLVERMEDTVSVPYADLPGFPVSTVASHAGAFVLGRLGGRTVLVQQGRCHLYEGFGPDKVCMGVRVMAGLGADTLILTNAAGALDPQFDAGGLMCISDQINFTGVSPLSGPNHEAWGERFPDMSAIYDAGLRDLACRCALELGIRLERGVYIGVRDPHVPPVGRRCRGHELRAGGHRRPPYGPARAGHLLPHQQEPARLHAARAAGRSHRRGRSGREGPGPPCGSGGDKVVKIA